MMYKLLFEQDTINDFAAKQRLEEKVQQFLNEGWKLHGPTNVTALNGVTYGYSLFAYSQAMIFEDDKANTPVYDDIPNNKVTTEAPKVEDNNANPYEYELSEWHRKVKEATAQRLTKLQEELRSTTETVQSIIKGVQETVREIRESTCNQSHPNDENPNN